ncbi:ABC transporter ATP-binding protein [Cohnella pontilimi]|uniref:ABC transporter ATP-binding protein n=1 Tax=Cohnella pontilimi TaxID=2564100 RepID=A0A4U0F219_9BACL|nr:ABC transporter ATP-binding protein [Cohnella pontilimi]TJY38521.1 ABC transporter ATP-binding protein [Cohnella pontilimi]
MNLLEVNRLTRSFGSANAVKDISFEIGDRRVVALLGPNGAGKTTTLSMLAGLLEPTSGDIVFPGLQGDRRRWIGFLPQIPVFFGWMTGRETMVTAGRLCGLSAKEAESRSAELLETVGLRDAANRKVSGYSGGMKQRLGLAQAVVHRPKLLILDEPVSALDPVGRRDVLDMLRTWKKDMTILLSTHILHDAEEVCDDLILLNQGRLVAQGTLEELQRSSGTASILVKTAESEKSGAWLQSLAAWPGVLKAEGGGYERRLRTNKIEEVREMLLRSAAEQRIPIVQFEAGFPTLEQWFLEAVRS